MIDLYYWGTPNGHKITIALEEMGLDYTLYPINILENDQFQPDFLKILRIIKFLPLLTKMVHVVSQFQYLNQARSCSI